MKWTRVVVVNCAVLLAGFVLIFAAGEFYYRFVYDDTDSFALTKVTKRWLQKYYILNNLGMRDDRDYSPKIAPNRTRVTFVGDSFTAGHGIEDVNSRFANILRRNNPDWEVQVFGVNGFDTGHENEFLADALNQGFQLDWVVLVYTLNDISDITPAWKEIIQRLYYPENRPGILARNSYLVNALHYRFLGIKDSDISNYFSFVTQAYNSSIWDLHRKRLIEMRNMVESHGGRFVVVTFPFVHATDESQYRPIYDKVDRLWHEQKIPHLNMSPVFRQYSPKQLTVNRFDAHPNEFAHALAAASIGAFLTDQMHGNR